MLQKLSYLNLITAIAYLLIYLKSGTVTSTTGIAAIIIFNWLAIRSYQIDDYRWKIWHWLSLLWSLYFIGFIFYGAINLLKVSIEVDYFGTDTVTNIIITLIFSAMVGLHLITYWHKRTR